MPSPQAPASTPSWPLFDTDLDCGLFHVFDDGDRSTHAGNLRSVAAPCGRYFLLCCSDTFTRT
jgi:hypothetical protein